MTTHDAMGYYSKAYGIPIEGALGGISTEEAPTAARVGELVKVIRQAGVPTIFAEKTINPRLIETVAREANLKKAEGRRQKCSQQLLLGWNIRESLRAEGNERRWGFKPHLTRGLLNRRFS